MATTLINLKICRRWEYTIIYNRYYTAIRNFNWGKFGAIYISMGQRIDMYS